MKRLTALALLFMAIGAIVYFWPSVAPQPSDRAASQGPPHRDAALERSDSAVPAQPAQTTPAPSSERAAQSGAAPLPPAAAARIELRAPGRVRHLDTFLVPIDMQALRSMRHLEFSVTYKKSVLRLLGSSPDTLAQQKGVSVHFEESSEGHLIVRIDLESGVHADVGTVAVLEFQARSRGVSPLSVEEVSYVDDGGQHTMIAGEIRERSITVE